MGAGFMAGYGYVEFAGPKEALFHAAAIRIGLLVLGPNRHYPAHAHPAEEIYHPLTAGGEWRRGEEPWRSVDAGSAIHHPPMMAHETQSGAGNAAGAVLLGRRHRDRGKAELTANANHSCYHIDKTGKFLFEGLRVSGPGYRIILNRFPGKAAP